MYQHASLARDGRIPLTTPAQSGGTGFDPCSFRLGHCRYYDGSSAEHKRLPYGSSLGGSSQHCQHEGI